MPLRGLTIRELRTIVVQTKLPKLGARHRKKKIRTQATRKFLNVEQSSIPKHTSKIRVMRIRYARMNSSSSRVLRPHLQGRCIPCNFDLVYLQKPVFAASISCIPWQFNGTLLTHPLVQFLESHSCLFSGSNPRKHIQIGEYWSRSFQKAPHLAQISQAFLVVLLPCAVQNLVQKEESARAVNRSREFRNLAWTMIVGMQSDYEQEYVSMQKLQFFVQYCFHIARGVCIDNVGIKNKTLFETENLV